MAAKNSNLGMHHPTVVPTNFEQVVHEREEDDEADC